MAKTPKGTGPKFEENLQRLSEIVGKLESGDLPLEKALELFEEGVKLSRACLEKLDEAEQKIDLLLQGADGRLREKPLPGGESGDDFE